ncbi:glutamate decarboxylase [Calothrix sp. NIES-2100]|uniref:glutamate decarboxylase n=1 Tax=Calothrix sp. NIES-2100 TaxID=1954172 RepID=UPI000B60814C|nr:glutamate decarboxylase [Calothrix sp. NIES-2100]
MCVGYFWHDFTQTPVYFANSAEALLQQVVGQNFIDQFAYPILEEIHQQVIGHIGELFNAPDKCELIGTATVGSSEAIMLGLLAHKFTWRRQREQTRQPSDRPNIVMGNNVHVCWEKFSLYFDVPSRVIPVETNQCILTADQVAKEIDENTIAVSCVLGNTYTAQLDEIANINDLLLSVKQERGWDIPIHVDAAIGGFITPFAHPELQWDFRLEQVKSINVSNHKFGLVYPGMGTLLFRDRSVLPEELVFDVSYMGNVLSNYGLNFSRPSAMVLLQYYNFLRLGKAGYRQIVLETLEKAQALESKLLATGYFETVSDSNYLPILVLRLKHPYAHPTFAVELSQKLRERHWVVPSYALPLTTNTIQVLRLVVKQNWTFDMIELITKDIEEIMTCY